MSNLIISVPDALRQSVEAATGGRVTVLYDAQGLPNYMYVIPRFRYEDLGFSAELGAGNCFAFYVNGVEKSEIFLAVYPSSNVSGAACSLPGRVPWVNINYDSAVTACTNKGPGWHLLTAHEWAAVALMCMANGYEPRGNTEYGRSHEMTHEFARRSDGQDFGVGGHGGVSFTGTGPDTWRHDGSPAGIADLVGNVEEWTDGIKLVDSQIYCTQDNDFNLADANWTATGHFFGRSDFSNAELYNSDQAEPAGASLSMDWSDMTKDAGYVESQLLQRLLISPAGISPKGYVVVQYNGENFLARGGTQSNAGGAGLAAMTLRRIRSWTNGSMGFRAAYIA